VPICLKVPRGEGEPVRKKVMEAGLLDLGRRIGRDGVHVLIPVTSPEAASLGYEIVEAELPSREVRETDYRKLADVPEDLREALPSSFDIIGDVAVIKLSDELMPFAGSVGGALMAALPRLKTVAVDKGVRGELRIREIEVVAGRASTLTTHLEHGARLEVDPALEYFNPRLSTERMRIASLVRDGEVVVDMFAGVGPFAIAIAKHARPSRVVAMDLNEDAVARMRRNIALNKVEVEAWQGDSRELIRSAPLADRVVMNLPHSAMDFLGDALARMNAGGTAHLYAICDRGDADGLTGQAAQCARDAGVRVSTTVQELKTYSPSSSMYALDVRLLERL